MKPKYLHLDETLYNTLTFSHIVEHRNSVQEVVDDLEESIKFHKEELKDIDKYLDEREKNDEE